MLLIFIFNICTTLLVDHICEAQGQLKQKMIFGIIQDQPLVNSTDLDSIFSRWNANQSIRLNYTNLYSTANLTEMEILQFVSRVSCSGAAAMITLSPCDRRLIRTLSLSRVPTIILNPEPICFPETPDVGDAVMLPSYLPVHDAISMFADNRYGKVVIIHDQSAEPHLLALVSSLESRLSPAAVISGISIKKDTWSRTPGSQILDILEQSNLIAGAEDILHIVWAETTITMQLLKQVKKERVSERYAGHCWLVVCVNQQCLDDMKASLSDVMLYNFAVLIIQQGLQNGNVHAQIEETITSLAQIVQTTLATGNNIFYTTNASSCQKLDDAFVTDLLLPHIASASDQTCIHYEAYIGNGDLSAPEIRPLGMCNNGTLIDDINIFPKHGLGGKHLTVTTIESSPFVLSKMGPDGKLQFEGMVIEMLQELANRLNFTYTISRVPDGTFGGIKDDGVNWSGLVGQLQRKEVDMSVASLSVTDSRETVIDFVDYYFEYGGAIMKKPDDDEAKWRVILQPFKWHVWLCLVFSVPFAGIVAWIISVLAFKMIKGERDDFVDAKNSTWYTFGALLTQGGTYLPRSASGRTFVCSWWFFSIIVVATYGGSLIAYLTISKIGAPFVDMHGLVKQDRYKWGFKEGTVYHNTFKNASGGVYRDLWEGVQKFAKDDPSVLSDSTAEHWAKVEEGNYVFIMDRTPLVVRTISDETCGLVMLSEMFMPLPFGLGLPKNSPYKAALYEGVKQLRQSGLVQYWEKKWWPKQSCSGIPIPEAHKVSLMDTQSAFYLLLVGVAVAALVLCTEQIRKEAKKRKVHSGQSKNRVVQNGGIRSNVRSVARETHVGNGHAVSVRHH